MKQTTDSSLRNESLKWQEELSGAEWDRISNYYYPGREIGFTYEEIEGMYIKETNPKAIIGSGVEEKHTKGEWETSIDHGRDAGSYPNTHIMCNGKLIAVCYKTKWASGVDKEEAEANAKLICEAVNNYPALKKQLELEAQCQSLLRDENDALRDSNAELLKVIDLLINNAYEAVEWKVAYQIQLTHPVTATLLDRANKWKEILESINKAKQIK